MSASGPAQPTSSARWVAAILVSGVGLAGVGYSVATRPMPPPPPVVFVPQQVEPRVSARASEPAVAGVASSPEAAQPPEPIEGPVAYEPVPKVASGMTIDVNTATAEQLQLLPGIGPSRAAAIIESRQAIGPFRTVEDLARVRGIGPATVEGVRPYVAISADGGR